MPVLQNPKHERFAQELAKGKTATEAYIIAGYKDNDSNACQLAKKVTDRVTELNGRAAERATVTIESLIREAAEIQAAASKDGQHAAATQALTAKAKLAGLWIERTEGRNENMNYAVGDEPVKESEWAEQHATEH